LKKRGEGNALTFLNGASQMGSAIFPPIRETSPILPEGNYFLG
jgi:hypothetical protein